MVGVKSVCRKCNPINWRFIVALFLGFTSSLAQAGLTISDGETFSLNSAESLTVSGNLTIENNASLLGDTAGDATIRVDGNWSNSGTFTHNNDAVFLTGTGASIVSGSNTFHTLVADHAESDTGPGKAITFAANTTQTIAHTLTLKGSSGNLMALASTSPGSAATLDVTGATVTASYLDIADSILSGYSASKPGDTNSTDNGGNSGWFNTAPTITSTALTSIGADEVYSYTVTANDADGDAVTLSATTIPSWLTFTPSTGVLTGTAESSNLGAHNTVITASDNFGGSVTDSFVITVSDVTAPVITLTGDAVVSLEQATTYNDDGATASDNIDGDITGNIVTVNPVDVDTVGSYTVTYNVSDAAGNAATQVTRTVNITADATAPVITLIGNATVSVASGDTYTDDGATATDNVDGDITGSIVTVNSVDTSTVGTYTVTYNVTDATGNVATEVTRTVNVLATADTTLPEIMLVGDDSVSIEQGTVYTDAGATASDNVDGDITASIVTVNPVDTTLVGTYTVTYNVSDSSGNTATEVTRTVTVTPDATAPVIALVGDASVSIEQGTAYNELGATATDAVDDNTTLSSNIVIDSSTLDVTSVGTYSVTYNVSDTAGNAATEVTRTVNVTADVTPPVITLQGEATVSVELGSAYVELGATATDAVDDDTALSNNIVIDASAVDVNTAGTYSVTYNVSDAAGNAATEVVRTVNVAADIVVPVINLIGDATVSVELGSEYTDAGATASDNLDGDITAAIVTVNPVDVNTVGTYNITYNVTDSSGNQAVEVTRTVTVSESGLFLSTDAFALVEGETDSFAVKLKAAPLGSVVINLTSSDEAEVTLSTATLTFNDNNWDTKQTVIISAVDDYNLDDSSAVVTLAVDKSISHSSFHNVADKTISISIENNDTALGLIEQFNNGDGTTPPPPSLSLYQQELGITGITQDNLVLVNAAVLAADAGGADTVAKIQAIVDAVLNQSVFETALNVASVDFDTDDEVIASLLDQHALGLAAIVAMIDQGNQAMGYQSALDRNLSDTVSVTAGLPELGDKDGLLQIDSSPDLELFIDVDGDTVPDLMWNLADNRVERVSFHLTGMIGHTSQDIADHIGYPMHASTLAGVPSQPQLSGSADDANHPFKLWAYLEDQLIAVTETIYTSATADENGQYAWQVTTEDYIHPLANGDNMLIIKGSVSLPLPVTVSSPSLSLSMKANRKQASVGSVVTYTVQIDNSAPYPLNNIAIRNDIPLGFNYVENSAHWDHDGDAQTPMVVVAASSHDGGKVLQFDLGNVMEAPISQELRYQLRIGSGVNKGDYTNSVAAANHGGTPTILSDDLSLAGSQASADIRVIEDALFELSTVIGKVFNDVNGNGLQDPGDLPVPYARLVTSAGQQVTADADGQYHLGNMRPGRMVVRIDERSLPEQTTILSHRSQIVDIRPGIPSKVNFAVKLPSVVDNIPLVRIEQLSKRLEPSLNIGVWGLGQIDSDQQRFVEPLEIRAYSNYAAFIKHWQVTITEDFSRRVVKTFSGTGSDLFSPIYWDGMTDEGELIDPQRAYYVELLVSDTEGREASTYGQSVPLEEYSEQFELSGASDREDDSARASSYIGWLQGLTKEDTTARSHIRVMGKSIRVMGEHYSAVRISQDNQLLTQMPSYDKPQRDVIDILRGISLSEDLSQETQVELIVPKGKLNVQVLTAGAATPMAMSNAVAQTGNDFPKISQVSIEFLLQQEEYSHTVELSSSDDLQQLLEIAEDYRESDTISRFAFLIVDKGNGNYALIYGIYHNYKEAERSLQGEVPRALVDSGAQIRTLQSMQSKLHADNVISRKSQVIFDQSIDTQALPATNDYFLVGIVDAEIAYRDITDNIDLAQSGDSRYGDKIWKDGKVQLYFKGTVAGDYLVTASIDSERDRDDLFSNLDPDASYALYGDNASVNDLVTEADGALYLLVEKDLSWAKWGRLQAALDNSELASFQRSLQGAQVHYESTQSTAYGEAVTEADAFTAKVRQKSAHIEFLSTGSSLYYLKHQGAIRDSLRLRLEARDAVSGNVKTSRDLTLNDDYQFDAASGRITFWMPPEREIESDLIIGSERGAVDQVYLVADYSYSIADDWSQGVSGGQIEQAFGDHLRLGVTQVEEQQQSGTYTLEGINSTIRLGKNHTLELEYARSESRAEPKYVSTDGGLSWGISESDISASDSNQSGDAVSLRGRGNHNDGRTRVNYYARDISGDFSSGGNHHQRGQRAAGIDLSQRLSEDLSIRLKHDWQQRLDDGDTQSNHRTGAQESSSSSLQVNYDIDEKLSFSGEVRHQTATNADPLNLTESNRDGETYAVQGRYRFDETTEISLTQQGHISGDADSQTRVGLNKHFNDKFSLQARVSDDGSGTAFGVASAYNLHDKLSISTALAQDSAGRINTQIGTGYSPDQDTTYNLAINERRDSETEASQSLALGTSRKLGNSTTLGTGTSVTISGKDKRNSSDINLSHQLADGRELRGDISRYSQQEDNDGYTKGYEINLGADINSNWTGYMMLGQGDIHRIDGGLDKRRNMAVGSAYIRRGDDFQELLTGRLRIEQREDRGQRNIDTYLVDLDIKGRINDDFTLISSLDWGESENLDSDMLEARNNRLDLGLAYRPVLSDRLNLIGKYSWVDNKQPDDQIGDIRFEQHKGHVLATDILYDLNTKWRIGAKLAARYGEEKMPQLPWTETERWLGTMRLGYRFNPDITLYAEYRMLRDLQAKDQKEGTVIELVRRFDNIEVGIGFNYAGFNDDLGIMDYTEQRSYLRITTVFE